MRYKVENTSTGFTSSGFHLSGTFTRPKTTKISSAILILNGSGPLDRNSNMETQKLNIANSLADSLAKAGIASFRYDKRGVGASEGNYWSTSFNQETEDAAAALEKLRQLIGQDSGPVIVLGHSVGATIAIRLAARANTTDGCILLAGAAHKGWDVMVWQTNRVAETLPFFQRLFKSRFIKKQAADRSKVLSLSDDSTLLDGEPCNIKWMKEYMAFNPLPLLSKIKVPVLAITGQKDIQVDFQDLALMHKMLPGKFEGISLVSLTHLLREDTGAAGLKNYTRQMAAPVSKIVPAKIIEWVKKL